MGVSERIFLHSMAPQIHSLFYPELDDAAVEATAGVLEKLGMERYFAFGLARTHSNLVESTYVPAAAFSELNFSPGSWRYLTRPVAIDVEAGEQIEFAVIATVGVAARGLSNSTLLSHFLFSGELEELLITRAE